MTGRERKRIPVCTLGVVLGDEDRGELGQLLGGEEELGSSEESGKDWNPALFYNFYFRRGRAGIQLGGWERLEPSLML